jgi:hypothetical protein
LKKNIIRNEEFVESTHTVIPAESRNEILKLLYAGYPKGHTVKSGMTKVLDTGLFVSPAGGGKGVEGKAEDDRIIGLDIHLRHCVTPPPAEDTE